MTNFSAFGRALQPVMQAREARKARPSDVLSEEYKNALAADARLHRMAFEVGGWNALVGRYWSEETTDDDRAVVLRALDEITP